MINNYAEGIEMERRYEGVLSVLKPPGLTSSDVVTDLRRIFEIKRIGHAGTLDPGAAGVLLVCVGRATRLFDHLVDKKKEYIAEIEFGVSTDTQDSYGQVTGECDKRVNLVELIDILPRFTGNIEQCVPIYSAANQDGVKLYKLARAGAPIREKLRTITIYSLDIIRQTGHNRFLMSILCSKGTYIRTLCHDIGIALGTYAHMRFLLRTLSGEHVVENAYSIAELRDMKERGLLGGALTPVDAAVSHIPEIRIDLNNPKQRRMLINGAEIPYSGAACSGADALYRVYLDDEFLGLGAVDNGKLRISLMLN